MDTNGKVLHCTVMNITLQVPANSVELETQLEICRTDTRNVPLIPCDFGEVTLSDVVKITPLGVKFNTPATLSIAHNVVDLPEHSYIVVKFYDCENNEWLELPLEKGRRCV